MLLVTEDQLEAAAERSTLIRVQRADAEWVRRVAFERRCTQGDVVHEALELYRKWSRP